MPIFVYTSFFHIKKLLVSIPIAGVRTNMRVGGGGPQQLVSNSDRFNVSLGQVNFNVNVQTRMEPVIDVTVDRGSQNDTESAGGKWKFSE